MKIGHNILAVNLFKKLIMEKQRKRIAEEWEVILLDKARYGRWWEELVYKDKELKERWQYIEDKEILLAEKLYVHTVNKMSANLEYIVPPANYIPNNHIPTIG